MQGSHSPIRTTPGKADAPQSLPANGSAQGFQTLLHKGLLLSLLASLSLFAACEWPVGKITPLREPPLVPSPPDAPVETAAPEEVHVSSYADTEAIQQFSPALGEAVSRALQMNVLKPATPQTKFEPEKPICYGEFRQWANDYQNAINTAQSQSTATAISPDSPPPAAGPLTPPASLTASTKTWLPSEMLWGAYGVREQTILTREALCALAVFLNGQDSQARKLNPSQIANAQPGSVAPDDTGSPDGVLSQLSDYSKISPWAQRYVALSYKNDWLEPIFGISPAKIIADDGFQPSQSVSRGEALLMLDLLFGHKQPTAGQATPTSQTTGANANPMGALDKMSKPQAQIGGTGLFSPEIENKSNQEQPLPIGHYESMRENSPHGRRQAIRVSGPE